MQPETSKPTLDRIRNLAEKIARPVRLMEVCGTHTVAVCRSGLRSLLPRNLALLSGPGCPVCVTPASYIDKAIRLARQPGVALATFGDLMRVPGAAGSLERARAGGAEVRVVYSVLDALALARQQKKKDVVFLAVGFETTAPGIAWAVQAAAEKGPANFAILGALKTMPNTMAALLRTGAVQLDGFICPGHVSAIIGARPYGFICRQYRLPCVIAGFEPLDVLRAIAMLLEQIAAGRAEAQNAYQRAVSAAGNLKAQRIMAEVFDPSEAEWRGLGLVAQSGLRLKSGFKSHDADFLFPDLEVPAAPDRSGCRCGDVLCGRVAPPECGLYGKKCTPATPVGACMVSSEGACAAYYRYCRTAEAGAPRI